MAASLGLIGSFNSTVEDWTGYTQRIGHYFLANGITDSTKKRSILLTACGPAINHLIRDLLSPGTSTEKLFHELVELLKQQQDPAPSVILQRYNFFTRKQHSTESIGFFMAQLRKLAHHCNFGDTLDDMLRDRLVCGCRDRHLQFKLLSNAALTFKTALEAAKADKTTERGTKDLTGGHSLHKMYGQQKRHTKTLSTKPPTRTPMTQLPTQPCFRCGAAHSHAKCKIKNFTCHYCQKQGHLASVCRKKARDQTEKKGKTSQNLHIQAHNYDSE